MTPNEKAIELAIKFCSHQDVFKPNKSSKRFALIAVNEIIKEYGTYYKTPIEGKYVSYWEEVKQELEKR